MNNSLIEIKNTEEIENKINNRNKTQSVKNTSFDLYERTKEKINKQKIVIQELEKLKTQKETQECTFKPVINKNVHSRNSLKIYRIDHEKREIDFFDRNTVWNMKKNDNIELIKFFNTKKDDECTFHPKINKSSRPFSLEKDNKNPPKCVERVKNSTKNKEFNDEKSKKIISSNINLKIDNNFSVREASHKVSKDQYISNEKESRNCNKFNSKLNLGFIKSSLRNELHSIKFNDEYNF